MQTFLQKHGDKITGVLSGLDRIVFRGTIRQLSYLDGLESYLATRRILLKEFSAHAAAVSTRLKDVVRDVVEAAGRPVRFLPSSKTSKEEVARTIAKEDRVTEGTICLLTSVEPCQSFIVYRCRDTKHLQLRVQQRKCLFLYKYFIDDEVGFGHARIQSWFPFGMQVCLNGREWLSRQLDRAGLGYCRRENCFTWLEDVAATQALMDRQLCIDWPQLLARLGEALNPERHALLGEFRAPYYWSTYQSEWATDFMFRDAPTLAQLYPRLLKHGISNFGSRDVLRFLGRNVPSHRTAYQTFQGEVVSDLKQRPEGLRIKHSVKRNSIKLYDKQGSVMRVETTLNDPRDFKVYRPKEGAEDGRKDWRPMRQGIADLHRRCEVSHAANERYVEALAAIDNEQSLGDLAKRICKRTAYHGRAVRALRPWSDDDLELFRAIGRGEYAINGFRNRQIRVQIYRKPTRSPSNRLQRAAAIGRRLRILRGHGLIQKVPKTHRYKLTKLGRTVITAVCAAYDASVCNLTGMAA